MFLPTKYLGPVLLNFRAFPIRINSNKYIGLDGKHLTWAEVEAGVPHTVFNGNSGGWYDDQHEISWDELTKNSGSPKKIIEVTSVTKLPRRVATFSVDNVMEALKYNNTGHEMYVSINFMNYVDNAMSGMTDAGKLTEKAKEWLSENTSKFVDKVWLLGTGMNTEDMIVL